MSTFQVFILMRFVIAFERKLTTKALFKTFALGLRCKILTPREKNNCNGFFNNKKENYCNCYLNICKRIIRKYLYGIAFFQRDRPISRVFIHALSSAKRT